MPVGVYPHKPQQGFQKGHGKLYSIHPNEGKHIWKNKAHPMLGKIPWNWKGDNVGYTALHDWVRKVLGKPTTCEHCGKTGLTGMKIHWANKSGQYLRRKFDWIRLCVSCHRKHDFKNKLPHFESLH